MYILISVARDDLEICESFHRRKEDAIEAMVGEILQVSLSYSSLDDIVDAADSGECGFSDDSAWVETARMGTIQWKIVEIPKKI